MKLLRVYQIYFKPEQLQVLEPEYIPFLNDDCSVYFESQVMLDLILDGAHRDSEYFAVVSHKLREKIGSVMKERWENMPNIANHSTNEFSPQIFESVLQKIRPDVMSFQRHIGHDPISVADRFHPGFSKYFAEIMAKIGVNYKPVYLENVFYCNFFAAKSELYEKFVVEMLIPAMYVMKEMPELMGNSRYPNPLPQHLVDKFGITWFPYHSFLCERMFSYWVHLNNLKCLHY